MRTATAAAAPQEMPERIPSSRASRRAISMDSSLRDLFDPVDHGQIERVGDEAGADALDLVRSRLERLACAAVCVITGLSVGSTATERIGFFLSFLK